VTGTGNSKYLIAAIGQELSRSKRFGRPLTVAYLDVVHLREVNQMVGHVGGDTLLSLVAHTIKRYTRTADVVTRLGGDEFVLLLPETDETSARVVMDRITGTLREILEQDGWPASVAVGVASFATVPDTGDEAIKQAERAMQAAKAAGPGNVEYVAPQPTAVAS
jgi:diguanylate cyclase (GGDEF)-like protein